MEPPLDNPGGRVAAILTVEVNCLAKAVAISRLRLRNLKEKVIG